MLLYSPQPVTWTRCISILCTCHVWYFRVIVSFLYFTLSFLYFTCSCILHSCTIVLVLISCTTFLYFHVYSCILFPVLLYSVHNMFMFYYLELYFAPLLNRICCRYACRTLIYSMG
ncbi:putative serine/arginine repetitive matrix protein 5 isoform X2 [Iris pallida]|uniref:Serine/arginine repetitive matrix protein 5 isoform X2 n=1 Tax=Iris pallida TaxID=29817 RepID=A0AAX6G3E0_IRIPA|nr:putative serine/arginine repetitive matrix protein 5 isoform X2 [Iris pallida]